MFPFGSHRAGLINTLFIAIRSFICIASRREVSRNKLRRELLFIFNSELEVLVGVVHDSSSRILKQSNRRHFTGLDILMTTILREGKLQF
jgi:hypothetical protein